MLHNSRSNRNAANDSDPLGNMTWGLLVTEGDPPDFGLLYPEWLTVTFFLSTLHAVWNAFSKVVLLSAAGEALASCDLILQG